MAIPGALEGLDTRRHQGVFPAFICWGVPFHPSERLPATGSRVKELRAFHPDAAAVRRDLDRAGVGGLIEVESGSVVRLGAVLETAGSTREIW